MRYQRNTSGGTTKNQSIPNILAETSNPSTIDSTDMTESNETQADEPVVDTAETQEAEKPTRRRRAKKLPVQSPVDPETGVEGDGEASDRAKVAIAEARAAMDSEDKVNPDELPSDVDELREMMVELIADQNKTVAERDELRRQLNVALKTANKVEAVKRKLNSVEHYTESMTKQLAGASNEFFDTFATPCTDLTGLATMMIVIRNKETGELSQPGFLPNCQLVNVGSGLWRLRASR